MPQAPHPLERFAPLTGLVFSVVIVAVFVIAGDTPDPDDSASKWVSYWSDNDTRELILSAVGSLAVLFFVWFAGTLRARLRTVEGSPGRLSNTAFGGAIMVAIGLLLFMALNFAAADTVDDVPPQVTHTISILSDELFFPLAVGNAVLMLAVGVLVVRTGALPLWLGWVAVVIGVASVSPVGFFAFLVTLVWVAIVSVLTYLRPAALPIVEEVRPTASPPPAA